MYVSTFSFSIFLSLFFYPTIQLPIYLSNCLSTLLSMYTYAYINIYPSLFLVLSLRFFLPNLFIYLHLHPSSPFFPPAYLSKYHYVYPSIYPPSSMYLCLPIRFYLITRFFVCPLLFVYLSIGFFLFSSRYCCISFSIVRSKCDSVTFSHMLGCSLLSCQANLSLNPLYTM